MPTTPSRRAPAACLGSACTGVTLIESMIVLAIVGILVSVAVPSFSRFLSNHRASTATNDLVHAIALVRSEALKRGRRVYLAPRGARWRDGWAIFVDRNDDRTYNAGSGPGADETIALHDALPASIDITKPSGVPGEPMLDVGAPRRPYLMYDGTGYSRQRNGALHFGSFLVVDRTGAETTMRTICIGSYGRVRVVVDRATC